MLAKLETGNKVCDLKKSIYGLRQAGKSWHIKLNKLLLKFGAKPSNADLYVYIPDQGKHIFLIIAYVDDILASSKN